MKLFINLSLFLSTLIIIDNKSFSLTDYKIKIICKKEKYKSKCIKDLQEKKFNLEKGNLIEIPVVPYKK